MKRIFLIVPFLVAVSISLPVGAGMRCENGQLANKRDTTSEVSIKCGKPFRIEKFGRVTVGDKKVYLERWTYVPEQGQFRKHLEFHNGSLVKITNGKRVK